MPKLTLPVYHGDLDEWLKLTLLPNGHGASLLVWLGLKLLLLMAMLMSLGCHHLQLKWRVPLSLPQRTVSTTWWEARTPH